MRAKPQTYIVRIWLEAQPDGPDRWRASVLEPGTRERHLFSNPQELTHFLHQPQWSWQPEETAQER